METYLIIITLLALVMQFAMWFKVGISRPKYQIIPPAISGNIEFERLFRAHQNTVEYMPMFLVLLWLAGLTGGDTNWVGVLGWAWIIARIIYFIGYAQGNPIRTKGFMLSVFCLMLLLLTTIYNLSGLSL